MIVRLNSNEGVKRSETTAGQRELLREQRNKINELVDAVNELEDVLAGSPDDDDLDDCSTCPDCRLDVAYGALEDLSDDQLRAVIDEAEGMLERRSQDEMKVGIGDDEEGDDSDVLLLSEEDGMLYDFAAYCEEHPEERLWQALRNWSGYSFIFGSTATGHDDYSQLEDTFYQTTKGPAR